MVAARLFFLLSFAVCLLISCKHDKPPIDPKKMEAILYDVQTAEVYSTMAGKDSVKDFGQKNEDSLAAYYAAIFKHYNISVASFKTAVEWYRARPSELDSIYSKLLPKLDANR